jgi:hypothetical protein
MPTDLGLPLVRFSRGKTEATPRPEHSPQGFS